VIEGLFNTNLKIEIIQYVFEDEPPFFG